MALSMEAEMARFEEEISAANEESSDEFRPPPLPPVMPPMFLPHALQSNKGNTGGSTSDGKVEASFKSDQDLPTGPRPDNICRNNQDVQSGSSLSFHGRNRMQPSGIGSNNSCGVVGLGPRPLGPGLMGPNSLPPGFAGPRLATGPIGPGHMFAGPLAPLRMLGPNPGLPGHIGMNKPNFDHNMMGPMPPPMPTFFPPPALPDFGNMTKKQQQTVYSAAPVLKSKILVDEDKQTSLSPTQKTKANRSAEKAKGTNKETSEISRLPSTISKSDDRLSEVGPEAGPHVRLQSGPPVPVMMPPSAYGQPALYDLSPLAGNPEMAKAAAQGQKKKKIIRTAAGQKWEDQSLQDWDTNDYRIFCGDLGNEVTDDTLARIFSRYSSFQKARVVREKNSKKTKGYGFVSFKDPNDFIRAMREINGKYVGNRPIKLRKSNWKDRNIDIVRKKVKEKKKLGYKV